VLCVVGRLGWQVLQGFVDQGWQREEYQRKKPSPPTTTTTTTINFFRLEMIPQFVALKARKRGV
jgi:hypothetical protein